MRLLLLLMLLLCDRVSAHCRLKPCSQSSVKSVKQSRCELVSQCSKFLYSGGHCFAASLIALSLTHSAMWPQHGHSTANRRLVCDRWLLSLHGLDTGEQRLKASELLIGFHRFHTDHRTAALPATASRAKAYSPSWAMGSDSGLRYAHMQLDASCRPVCWLLACKHAVLADTLPPAIAWSASHLTGNCAGLCVCST